MTIAGKRFSGLIILMAILVLIASGTGIISFAAGDTPPPPVPININAASHFQADLDFVDVDNTDESTPWCPGLAKIGSVRITNNNFGVVTIKNIGVEVANVDEAYGTFAANMHLKITDVNAGILLYDEPLTRIAHKAGTAKTGIDTTKVLNRGGDVELEFILSMNSDADDEMQGLTAQLAFLFNTEDTTVYSSGDSGTSGGGGTLGPAPAFLLAPGNWYDDCVEALLAHEIIIPEIDGEIRPNDLITRGEAAVLLGRALGLPEDHGSTGYLDTIPERYRGYINATTKAGVFRGYPLIAEMLPGRVFKPDNYITREELFCVLVRAYNVELEGNLELGFADKDDVHNWALEDIKAGVQKNVIGGYTDNSLKPQQFMSRSEAFALVCRLQGYHDHHSIGVGGGTQ